jgi:hypothetical protein
MVDQLGKAERLARRLHKTVQAVPGQFSAGEPFRAWLRHTRQVLDIKAAEVHWWTLEELVYYFMQLWRTLRTKQIDIDFQMPLHCGMVWKSTPTIYSTPTIWNSK